jgi:sulfatase maturation enzyme AslB (radical SAM superfamily)
MQIATFEKTIEWVVKFCKDKTQLELNLFGVGEPTLHPKVVQFVAYARQMLPFQHDIHLNTNGNTMTEELAKSLKDAGITAIDITGHDHYATAKTIRIFRNLQIAHRVSYDFVIAPNNWAGQVDWFTPEYNAGPCPWLCRGQVMVMSNGDVTTCCIDAFGKNILGNVFDDDLSELDVKYSELCKSCHHTVPDALQRA